MNTSRQKRKYEILYTKAADKFFRTHEEIRTQYEDAISRLITDNHPESVDLKRIQGKKSVYYRVRLGDYRVVYTVINGKIVVVTTLVAGSRGDIYKKMEGLK